MTETEKDTKPQHEEQEQERKEEQQEEQQEQAEVVETLPAEEVVTGGRQRRSTQKFGFVEAKEEEEEEFKPPVGPGAKVRDMDIVAERISHMGKKDAETVKALYNIMYGRRFQQKNIRLIKDHILDFTGIPDADEKTRQQLVGKIGRWMRSYLQDVMDILGVDRSKKSFDEEGKAHDKEGLINRLIDWLIEPRESGKAAKKMVAKKKTAAAKPAAAKKTTKTAKETAGTKRKSAATTKKPAKKAKTSAKKSAAPVEEEDEEDATESEVDKEEDEDSDFDEEDDVKAKKSKKKTPTKRAPRRNKKTAPAAEVSDAEEEAADNDEKMEDPVAKEIKEAQKAALAAEKPAETSPLGADVQKKVQEIIAKGDASQLTVKKIVRQLSEDMGQDFTPQKAAIKDFVTNLQM